MPKSKAAQPGISRKPKPPNWVDHKPAEYQLECYAFVSKDADDQGAEGTIERIDMTELEYMACKQLVARLRGFDVPEPAAANA